MFRAEAVYINFTIGLYNPVKVNILNTIKDTFRYCNNIVISEPRNVFVIRIFSHFLTFVSNKFFQIKYNLHQLKVGVPLLWVFVQSPSYSWSCKRQ